MSECRWMKNYNSVSVTNYLKSANKTFKDNECSTVVRVSLTYGLASKHSLFCVFCHVEVGTLAYRWFIMPPMIPQIVVLRSQTLFLNARLDRLRVVQKSFSKTG